MKKIKTIKRFRMNVVDENRISNIDSIIATPDYLYVQIDNDKPYETPVIYDLGYMDKKRIIGIESYADDTGPFACINNRLFFPLEEDILAALEGLECKEVTVKDFSNTNGEMFDIGTDGSVLYIEVSKGFLSDETTWILDKDLKTIKSISSYSTTFVSGNGYFFMKGDEINRNYYEKYREGSFEGKLVLDYGNTKMDIYEKLFFEKQNSEKEELNFPCGSFTDGKNLYSILKDGRIFQLLEETARCIGILEDLPEEDIYANHNGIEAILFNNRKMYLIKEGELIGIGESPIDESEILDSSFIGPDIYLAIKDTIKKYSLSF